jgi:hypothetical protein
MCQVFALRRTRPGGGLKATLLPLNRCRRLVCNQGTPFLTLLTLPKGPPEMFYGCILGSMPLRPSLNAVITPHFIGGINLGRRKLEIHKLRIGLFYIVPLFFIRIRLQGFSPLSLEIDPDPATAYDGSGLSSLMMRLHIPRTLMEALILSLGFSLGTLLLMPGSCLSVLPAYPRGLAQSTCIMPLSPFLLAPRDCLATEFSLRIY